MYMLRGIATSLVAFLLVAGVANAHEVNGSNCNTTPPPSNGGSGGNGGNTGGNGGSGGGVVTPPIVQPPTTPIVIPANAVFTTPDVNFVTHVDCAASLKNGAFSLTINSALGDSIQLDRGQGFAVSNGTVIINAGSMLETSTADKIQFKSGGTVTYLAGGKSLIVGQLGALTLTKTDLGYTYSAGFRAVSGDLKPNLKNDGGFFGLLYNIHNTNNNILANGFCASAKGDLAAIKGGSTPPTVPEPATMALVAMGLGGLFASARRRIG